LQFEASCCAYLAVAASGGLVVLLLLVELWTVGLCRSEKSEHQHQRKILLPYLVRPTEKHTSRQKFPPNLTPNATSIDNPPKLFYFKGQHI
jgi:hypothetical protein